MNVTILTSAHRWDDPRVFGRQARSLAKAGHSVRLVAPGAPSLVADAVAVSGPPRPPSRWIRMSATLWRLARSDLRSADVVHVHDPELLLVIGLMMPWTRQTAWVYDVHEDYSEQLRAKPWLPRPLRRPLALILAACERGVANRCDLVVAATPTIARRFDPQRTVVVENHPDVGALPTRSAPATTGEYRLLHLGEINARRGAMTLVSALAELPSDSSVIVEQMGPIKPPDLLDGAPARLRILPPSDHRTALQRLADADAGLLLFPPGPNHDFSQPNKLFEYLVSGVPVLASDIAHWRSLVSRCDGFAVFVDPNDPRSVRDGLLELERRSDGGDRAARAERARRVFSWESQEAVLLAAYEGLQRRSMAGRP